MEVKTTQFNISPNKVGHVQMVDLNNRTCTCQKLQLYGYYCSRMIVTCHNVMSYGGWQSTPTSTYRTGTTSGCTCIHRALFRPIPYTRPILLPETTMRRTTKGRPRSTHLHNEMDAREGTCNVRCCNCKKVGHNRRHCPKYHGKAPV